MILQPGEQTIRVLRVIWISLLCGVWLELGILVFVEKASYFTHECAVDVGEWVELALELHECDSHNGSKLLNGIVVNLGGHLLTGKLDLAAIPVLWQTSL